MNIVSQKLLSIYFMILPFFIAFWLVTKIFRRRVIRKSIQVLGKLSDDRKARIIRLYRNAISMERIGLWLAPIVLLLYLALCILFRRFPELPADFPDTDIRQLVLLGAILLFVGFIHILEDTNYKKKILKAIDKQQES